MTTSERIRQMVVALGCVVYYLLLMTPYCWLKNIYKLFVPDPPKSVKGEIVLITGTGHGMGRLLAEKYAKEGATVVGWDINDVNNETTLRGIRKLGFTKVYGYKCDISNREEVLRVAKKVQKEVGDVTILINNAGIMPSHLFLEHTEQEIRNIMEINVMGHFWTLQAFLPTMRKNNRGHVVCLSSMAGQVGCINLVPYNASKFAVRGLMEGLYEEFRHYPNNKVKFTTIYPFLVDTGLCKNYEISLDLITPMAKAQDVVEGIFKAQTQGIQHQLLPAEMTLHIHFLTKFLPQEVVDHMRSFLKADLKSDKDLVNNGTKKNM
ncbi:short-chain dehydrogenase/reductase family 16C member 6-like [Rhynchophorus ferrugineus]|uniref:short-chain dehydrogenase/reductase family 16C member 6-like n=1 Tax=Rhynchophorus ferrugineus TaxID=354439 RepID=UPI003FCE0D68